MPSVCAQKTFCFYLYDFIEQKLKIIALTYFA